MLYMEMQIKMPKNLKDHKDFLRDFILHPDLKFERSATMEERDVVAIYKSDDVPELKITAMWGDKKE